MFIIAHLGTQKIQIEDSMHQKTTVSKEAGNSGN